MRLRHALLSCLTTAALAAAAPEAAHAQQPGPTAASVAVRDLPTTAVERQRVAGRYMVANRDGRPAMILRIFDQDGTLMGQVRTNDPTRLLYQGGGLFRPAAAPESALQFTVVGGRAMEVTLLSPDGTMRGVRIEEQPAADPSVAGPLFDELARMDSVLFDAAYVRCSMPTLDTLLADDVEFYHDRTGFHAGAQVRADFARLTAQCPSARGIRRELVPGSLHVYPIADYGAVQVGVHRFVERGATSSTTAQFVHLWRKQNGAWRVERVLSYDHHVPGEP